MNIADYLRKRRLCYAAQLLAHRGAIIDISLHCHFESQESFTRAFKIIRHAAGALPENLCGSRSSLKPI